MCRTNELWVMFETNSKMYTRVLQIINDHINKRLYVTITATAFLIVIIFFAIAYSLDIYTHIRIINLRTFAMRITIMMNKAMTKYYYD